MTPEENERYDREVFDGARDLAVRYRNDPEGMAMALVLMGATVEEYTAVVSAMNDPDYYEDDYRGEQCDEGVIEGIKEVLRYRYGFNKR
jgi:hypothetical protein